MFALRAQSQLKKTLLLILAGSFRHFLTKMPPPSRREAHSYFAFVYFANYIVKARLCQQSESPLGSFSFPKSAHFFGKRGVVEVLHVFDQLDVHFLGAGAEILPCLAQTVDRRCDQHLFGKRAAKPLRHGRKLIQLA